MKIRIDHLDANPFRHIERYPIREDKIAALRESITKTGFWDNMVGRQVGDRIQIAYGHHRREALVREYGPDREVGIVVRDFSDEDMLQIMARENLEEWGSSASIELETVRAVVEAYGDAQIDLPDPRRPGVNASHLRWAPSFVQGGEPPASGREAPYTAVSVAEFLGWSDDKVTAALGALELVEQGHRTDADFAGIGTKAARAIVEETRRLLKAQADAEQRAREAAERAERQREETRRAAERAAAERQAALERAAAARESAERAAAARAAEEATDRAERAELERQHAEAARQEVAKANTQSERFRKAERTQHTKAMKEHFASGGGVRDLREATAKVYTKPDQPPPDINDAAHRVAVALHKVLDTDRDELGKRLGDLVKFRRHLTPAAAAELADELDQLRTRIGWFSGQFDNASPVSTADVIDAEIIEEHAL